MTEHLHAVACKRPNAFRQLLTEAPVLPYLHQRLSGFFSQAYDG